MTQTINVQLPDELAEQARSLGLLTDERLAEMIEAEIERRREAAGRELTEITGTMHAHMRKKYGDLTDAEAQAMIDQWIAEADEESNNSTSP